MLEQLGALFKTVFVIASIVVAFSSIYIYRVWTKDTSRKVRISIMGFSIELGEGENKDKK